VVLPIRDENPVRRVPVVTYLLIALNVAVFLAEPIAFRSFGGDVRQVAQVCRQEAYFDRWAAIPRELVHNKPLDAVVVGSAGTDGCVVSTPPYRKSPLLSAFTAMFLHGGWFHLLGNMLFLWIFGNNVEDRMGRLRYALFYLICGVIAGLTQLATDPSSGIPNIGASGAIAGVLGAYLVLYPRARVLTAITLLVFFAIVEVPAVLLLGAWFLLQVLEGSAGLVDAASTGGVANFAHIGGFVAGLVLVWLFVRGRPRPVLTDPR